jgi:hypothetical protein
MLRKRGEKIMMGNMTVCDYHIMLLVFKQRWLTYVYRTGEMGCGYTVLLGKSRENR